MREEKLLQENVVNENIHLLFQAHLSEYQMLTNRATYLITVAYGLWTLFAIFLTVLLSLWNSLSSYHFLLIWCGATILQIVIFLSNFLTTEIYDIATYLDTELRDMMENIIGKNDFWKYEKSLARRNIDFLSKNKESIIPFLTFPALIFVSIVRMSEFTKWDVLMVVINFGICFYNFYISKKLMSKRKNFSSTVLKSSN